MCRRGNWRGIDTTHIRGKLCAIEQCTECDEYRAKKIEDAPVVGFSQQQQGEPDDDDEDFSPVGSDDHRGW